jgi:TolB protein
MHRRALLPLVVLSLLAFAQAALDAAPAKAGGFIVNVSPGRKDLPLALPEPQALAGADATAAQVWEVVRRDLEMTGYFEIIDPAAYVERGKGVEPGTFDYADWRMIKAAALAKTRVQSQESGIRADVFVYDVNGGSKIDAKGFVGKTTDARYLGHKIADQILLALTGEKGFFGSRIAAVGVKNGHKEIFVMDIDGEGVAAVTNNATINLSPSWSPTGDRLVFTSYKKENADLYVKELKTGRLRAISERQGMDSGGVFSPDGSKIALTRTTNGDADIYVIDATTGADLQQLTNGGGIDVGPAWSPDGSKIAFSTERSGGQQVYVQDLSSGSATRVTFQGGHNTDPVWSPDGTRIAFVGRDRNFDVFVVDVDGRNMVRITQDQGDNEDPSWSPDGKYLIFSSTRNGKSEIWMSTADGRHQVPVTTKGGGWTQPSWGPY